MNLVMTANDRLVPPSELGLFVRTPGVLLTAVLALPVRIQKYGSNAVLSDQSLDPVRTGDDRTFLSG